jgi:tRNA A37 threonylcarbamoyltransferase TsaD
MTNLRVSDTGSAALSLSYTVPAGATFDLNSVTVKFSAAPVSAESLTITLDSAIGAAYDAVLYKVDPSATSATSIVWQPAAPLYLSGGDVVVVAYTNTDTRTWGATIAGRG